MSTHTTDFYPGWTVISKTVLCGDNVVFVLRHDISNKEIVYSGSNYRPTFHISKIDGKPVNITFDYAPGSPAIVLPAFAKFLNEMLQASQQLSSSKCRRVDTLKFR